MKNMKQNPVSQEKEELAILRLKEIAERQKVELLRYQEARIACPEPTKEPNTDNQSLQSVIDNLSENYRDSINRLLATEQEKEKQLTQNINQLTKTVEQLQEQLDQQTAYAASWAHAYQEVVRSSSWVVTRPMRVLKRICIKIAEILLGRQQLPRNMSDQRFAVYTAEKLTAYAQPRAAVPAHTQSVDIVICVHNAYEDVKRCIESVFEFTEPPYRLILIDDGSSAQTRDYLQQIATGCPGILLDRKEQGTGYTFAANRGLRMSSADWVVLLNSDTIVSTGWIDQMIACARSDPKIGVVGPLSNTASWQSVPKVFDADGDWAHNQLPEGWSVQKTASVIRQDSARIYPQVPLLNGFCLMISRTCLQKVGYLDEETFGRGFAEEDDFNLRAGKLGFKLAVADDTYIFHAQSKSYTDEKRLMLAKLSGDALRQKHGNEILDDAVYKVHENMVFHGARCQIRMNFECERLCETARQTYEGKRILFILPVATAGGGGNVVVQEALSLQKMGIDVSLFNISVSREAFETCYPGLPIPVIYAERYEDIPKLAEAFDGVVCTLYTTVKYCKEISEHIRVAYYIQDYEPYFFAVGSKEYQEAYASYTAYPRVIKMTKTRWNQQKLKEEAHIASTLLGPSVNVALFRPRRLFQNWEPIVITAMIRPATPRRSAALTMRVLYKIFKKYGAKVEIRIFGADPHGMEADYHFFKKQPRDFVYRNYGQLNAEQVACLMAQSDVFVDYSAFQAMGLSAMEAMASGCTVLLPTNGGTGDFARDGENCLMIDSTNENDCFDKLCTVLDDYHLRSNLAWQAVDDMRQFYPEKSALNLLKAMFGPQEENENA